MQKLFPGVTYYREEKTGPRKVVSHVLVIDTHTEGLEFLVTPPQRDTLPQLCTRTTSKFLTEQSMQIAINGDGFHYLDPNQYPPQEFCSSGGDPIRLIGYAASRGKVYSQDEPGHPILYINKRNEISFDKPAGKVYNAMSGDLMLVSKGKKVAGLDYTALHPRTACGVNQDGRWKERADRARAWTDDFTARVTAANDRLTKAEAAWRDAAGAGVYVEGPKDPTPWGLLSWALSTGLLVVLNERRKREAKAVLDAAKQESADVARQDDAPFVGSGGKLEPEHRLADAPSRLDVVAAALTAAGVLRRP